MESASLFFRLAGWVSDPRCVAGTVGLDTVLGPALGSDGWTLCKHENQVG